MTLITPTLSEADWIALGNSHLPETTMKIIKPSTKKPEWPKQGKCDRCGVQVEVEQSDVRDMADRPGEPTVWGVACPTADCSGHIYFRPSKL